MVSKLAYEPGIRQKKVCSRRLHLWRCYGGRLHR